MPERDTLGILSWPQYRVTKDQTRFMGLEKRRVSRNRGYRMSGVEVRVRHGGGLHIKEIEHDRDLESQHKDHARKEPVQGIQEPGGVGYGGMISAEYGRPVYCSCPREAEYGESPNHGRAWAAHSTLASTHWALVDLMHAAVIDGERFEQVDIRRC